MEEENAEENRKLFNNLYIEKSKYIEEQGKYPVIFLSISLIFLLNKLLKFLDKKWSMYISETIPLKIPNFSANNSFNRFSFLSEVF